MSQGSETYKNCGWKSFERTHYPQYDLCNGPLEKRFDVIIANQVFEHLLWPYRAAKNVYQSLNPGGYFVIATPFLVRVHNYPVDCSRWTELGLKHFLAEAGFSQTEIEALIERDGCRKLAFSLGPLKCIYSVFIARLIKLRRRITDKGGVMKLCDVAPDVMHVLESCKLETYFDFAADSAAAVAAFTK